MAAFVWGPAPSEGRPYDGPTEIAGPEGAAAESEQAAAGENPELSMEDVFGSVGEHDGEGVEDTEAGARAPDEGRARFLEHVDTRIRILTSAYLDIHRTEKVGFGRNENRLELYFAYTPNEHIQIVGDVEPVFMGVAQAQALDDIATRRMLTPFHVESDAAYVGVMDILPGLDIKIGRQIVVWGTADRFNPTNNINPDDLEDRPLFTEPIANQMVVVDYAPLDDRLWLQGVYVPLFYPALLPPSAAEALQDPDSAVPYVHENDLAVVERLQRQMHANESLIPHVNGHVVLPESILANGQAAAKIGTHLFGELDLSASYYYGRHDIPTPVNVESTQLKSNDPADYENPDEVLVPGCCFVSDAFLVYPRMQAVGLDFATQLGFLNNTGLWGEAALFFPEEKSLRIEFPIDVNIAPEGEPTDLEREMKGLTIRKRPFVKATAGLDYTFGKHVYVQGQYLRGFTDEFGAGHIGNYLVAGTDLIFFGRHLIIRLFGVVDFPTDGDDEGSYVIFPELLVTPPWGSVTFELGSFVLLGGDDTKFGQPAAGTSIAFLKAVGTF